MTMKEYSTFPKAPGLECNIISGHSWRCLTPLRRCSGRILRAQPTGLMFVYVYVYMCVFVYMFAYVYVHVCVCMCVCVCVCECTCTCVYMPVHIYKPSRNSPEAHSILPLTRRRGLLFCNHKEERLHIIV